MTFRRLTEYLQKLESTTLRNQMVQILASLFSEAKKEEMGKLCYLLQGRLVPLYQAVEFGVAEKMMIRALAQGLGQKTEEVERLFKKEGDLGKAGEKLKIQVQGERGKNFSISQVYERLFQVARASGEGSQEEKLELLASLLQEVDSLSARYIIRIPLGKLRLGFSEMTILDAFSWLLVGTKKLRPEIEKAYNVRPDLGFIGEKLKEKGLAGLRNVAPKVGTPILMAKAERLTTPEEIIEKLGKCALEPKFDGFRLQVHYQKEPSLEKGENLELFSTAEVRLFSRNLEDVTFMYPDLVAAVKKEILAREIIFEGEAVGFDPKSGRYLPFQETVQRKRKYAIAEMAKKIPLKLIAFDLLFLDGENLLLQPYRERRKKLEEVIRS